jgi:hypothetical protein
VCFVFFFFSPRRGPISRVRVMRVRLQLGQTRRLVVFSCCFALGVCLTWTAALHATGQLRVPSTPLDLAAFTQTAFAAAVRCFAQFCFVLGFSLAKPLH